MTQTVSACIQLAVRPALVEASGHHLIRSRRPLRLKQTYVAISQRVIVSGLVARLQQMLAFSGVHHGQVREVAVGLFADGQQ